MCQHWARIRVTLTRLLMQPMNGNWGQLTAIQIAKERFPWCYSTANRKKRNTMCQALQSQRIPWPAGACQQWQAQGPGQNGCAWGTAAGAGGARPQFLVSQSRNFQTSATYWIHAVQLFPIPSKRNCYSHFTNVNLKAQGHMAQKQ